MPSSPWQNSSSRKSGDWLRNSAPPTRRKQNTPPRGISVPVSGFPGHLLLPRAPRGGAWVFLLAAIHIAWAGASPTGPQLLTFRSTADGSEQPYALYVPKSPPADGKYPLVIGLHAEDSDHRLSLRRVLGVRYRAGEISPENLRSLKPLSDVPYLVACPLARGTMGYEGLAERDVYDMLADVERRFPVDPDRVYLTGMSMGGAGALRLALTQPDVWAAVAVVCPTPAPGLDALAENAIDLPVRLFHGEQDPMVKVALTRAWQRRLLDVGVTAEYIEYPAARHNAWELAYRDGAIFGWFGNYRRNTQPEHVHFTTDSYRYSSAYWVRIDGLTPGTPATIDARWNNGKLAVATTNIDGFSVTGTPGLHRVAIDGTALATRSLSFRKVNGRWHIGHCPPSAKRAGEEGPMAEAVAGPQIYVYGAGTRAMAERAAAWSTARNRLLIAPEVKADKLVTAADEARANLILFGDAGTNSVIARLAPELPLALNPGAADYGLLFIYPLGHRCVLVNSGLPWWTGADEAKRGGDPFAPWQLRLLETFGDYILYKGSLANVVAEGRFDRNWKVPPDAAAKLRATGTVTIR